MYSNRNVLKNKRQEIENDFIYAQQLHKSDIIVTFKSVKLHFVLFLVFGVLEKMTRNKLNK